MVKHYNPSIVERAQRILNTKLDNLPNEVSGPIATININPVAKIIRSVGATTTGNIAVYTTPADKDFYLTGASLSIVKDSTCDVTSGPFRLSIVIDGVTTYVINIALLTLTAQSENVNVEFATPIKIDRNTAIATTNSFTVGSCVRQATIRGYTEETTST